MSSPSPEQPDTTPKANPNTPAAIDAERGLLRAIQSWDSADFDDAGVYQKAKKYVLDEHRETVDTFEADNPVYTGLFRPKFEDAEGTPAYLCAAFMRARSAPSNAEIMVPAVQFVTYEMPTDRLLDRRVQIIQGVAVRLLDLDKRGELKPIKGFTEDDVDMVAEKLKSLEFCREPTERWGIKGTILPILPHLGPNLAAIRDEPSNA